MQSSGINALMALMAPAAAGNAASEITTEADEGAFEQAFSQLLSDSSGQFADPQNTQQFVQPNALLAASLTPGALAGQEVDTDPSQVISEVVAALGTAREQLITPEDASAIIKKIDKVAPYYTAPADVKAFAEIRQQLVAIQSGAPGKTVAEIIQTAPSVKEMKLSGMGLVALLSQHVAKKINTEQAQVQTTPQEAPDAAEQRIPAPMFRADLVSAPAPAAAAPEPEKKEDELSDTVTITEPVANVMTIAAPAAVQATPQAASTQDENEGVEEIASTTTAPKQPSLPEVILPKMMAEKTTAKEEKAETFETMANAAKEGDDTSAKQLPADGTTLPQDISALRHPQAPHSASGAQPTHPYGTGFVNHAPVAEQVHVAVKQAASDGLEKITIQLDPADLGRVEVHMTTNREGVTQISFLVDKAETFDGLSRDARSLERSLQESGIKADAGSMQFNLRQQPQPQLQSNLNGQGQNRPQQQAELEDDSQSLTGITPINLMVDSGTRNYLFNVREGVDISA